MELVQTLSQCKSLVRETSICVQYYIPQKYIQDGGIHENVLSVVIIPTCP